MSLSRVSMDSVRICKIFSYLVEVIELLRLDDSTHQGAALKMLAGTHTYRNTSVRSVDNREMSERTHSMDFVLAE